MATNCPRTRPSGIGAIIKKASKGAREHYSSAHADPYPIDIPPFGTIMKNSYLEWYNRCLHQGHWLSIWQWRGHQPRFPGDAMDEQMKLFWFDVLRARHRLTH